MFGFTTSQYFPPTNEPFPIPAPAAESSIIAPPFTIPPDLYVKALDVRVPITVAATYAVSVLLVNRYNKAHGNEPWPISKTRPFFCFVVAHNVLLALYSAWTFWGIFGALRESLAPPHGATGLAGTVDSLCKMHGPRGLGNAVTYNQTLATWTAASPAVSLGPAGTPNATDAGRLWNQGLAFYGWLFYLSKFYEVLDTAIILAKGKRSQTLQTYHHAGAMMCMWAGIRYMSPPIWAFVCVNSAIHAIMYTYYTLTALSIQIPQAIKRSLTTMQIIQFLVGATYASIHSISYTIPVLVQSPLPPAPPPSATGPLAPAVAPSRGLGAILQQLLFRAVGEEGLAGNAATFLDASAPPLSRVNDTHDMPAGVHYHTEYRRVPCIDTKGQTFAIWLNLIYLTPLTFLFARFFYKSYMRRGPQGSGARAVIKAGMGDASKGVERKALGETPNGGGVVLVTANGKKRTGNGRAL